MSSAVVAFETGGDGVDVSEGGGGGAVLLDFGSGIDIDAEIFGGLFGILGGFDGAEGSFDLDVIAFLGDVRALGDAIADDADA